MTRGIAIGLGITMTLAAFAAVALSSRMEPLRAFDASAAQALSESAALQQRAASFDHDQALADLRERAPSFVYSLAEYAEYAEVDGAEIGGAASGGAGDLLMSVEFGGDDAVALVPNNWKKNQERGKKAKVLTEIVDGNLVLDDWYWSNHLMAAEPLAIQPQDLGELEVRVKADTPSRLQVSWDTVRGPSKVWKAAIELIPDGEFHTYRTDLARLSPVLGGDADQTITNLLLRPNAQAPGVKRGDFEIAHVRLHNRRAGFSEPAARQLLRAGDEQRQGVYVNTPPSGEPLSLRYSVALPDAPAAFHAGLSAFQEGDPVTFRVDVVSKGETRTLLEEVVGDGGWHDVRAALDDYAGRRVELVLSASSGAGNIALWGTPEIYEPRADPMRIVVILEDTERGDHISALGYERPTTPFKDEFFSRGAIFSRAFAQAPKTRPSCVSFMTSLPTRSNGVSNSRQFLHDGFLTLPEILQSQGFATAVFTQNVNSGPSSGLHQGVDVIRDNSFLGTDPTDVYSQETLAWVERHLDRDFFLYLHLLDPHGAYAPPPSHRHWFEQLSADQATPVEPGKLDPTWLDEPPTAEGRVALYDGEIVYNDEQMRGFIEALGERVPLEDTLFVFLSDHGEHQGEEGLWGHHPPSLKSGIHVPLMFRYDRALPARGIVDTPAQLMDLSPTLLELAGVDASALPIAGRSLVPVLKGELADGDDRWSDRLVMSEENPLVARETPQLWSSLFFRDYHLLYTNSLPGPDPETPLVTDIRLYNYAEDPGETDPLDDRLVSWLFEARVEPMLLALAARNDAVRGAFDGGGDNAIEMDDNTLQELRELGYIE